jgi:hypothetical protein
MDDSISNIGRKSTPTQKEHQTSKAVPEALVLDVPVPAGTDPAILSSLRQGLIRAVDIMVSSGEIAIIENADELAKLLTASSSRTPDWWKSVFGACKPSTRSSTKTSGSLPSR